MSAIEKRQSAVKKRQRYIFTAIFLILCLCFVVTFSLSQITTDETAESFFINVSAGFFGSGFTFLIFTYFEDARNRTSKLAVASLSMSHITSLMDKQSASLESSRQLSKHIFRFIPRIDLVDPVNSLIITETILKMLETLIDIVEADYPSLEVIDSLASNLLNASFESGNNAEIDDYKVILESAKQLNILVRSTVELFKDSKRHLESIREGLIKSIEDSNTDQPADQAKPIEQPPARA